LIPKDSITPAMGKDGSRQEGSFGVPGVRGER
jgi:hypothetical protein